MAEDTQRNLRFSVEESVWLRKGQEVAEILSMSLEPDISIDENKHYVSVRGALKLIGEYHPEEESESEEDPPVDDSLPLQDQVSFRSIDEISLSESGTGQIEHRFPIDITIPYSRIESLDDIYVTVESFDYVLPEKNCIRVSADVAISGMVDDDQKEEETELEDERLDQTEQSEPEESVPELEVEAAPQPQQEEAYDPFHYEALRQFDETTENSDHPETVETQEGPLIEMKTRTNESEEPVQVQNQLVSSYHEEEGEDDTPQGRKDEEVAEEEEPVREENALYLTKMLTKEEEHFSSVKMCIIQRGESLSTIAARYDMQPSQLVRVNGLRSEEVEEGQILYIPASSSS